VPVAALVFYQCGSDRIDVTTWNGSRARIRCYTYGRESWLDGFTLSEFDPGKLIGAALVDQVRKHRKRPPDDERKIQDARRSGQN
jgi:hypothetical protein